MVSESTVICYSEQRYTTHTTNSLYDSDTWSLTTDYTIGQSGFCVEVSHYHGLGEQHFMRSMQPIRVTLQCSSQHQSPSPPKVTLIAWAHHDYVINVTDSLLLLPSPKGFSARMAQT
jgi:hypothetical protein